ncbi:hypothetical protein VCRA2114E365_150035 [Vibrio crassostreae]|nr:hypothetical protein VCRA2115O371_130085 [Vibrio crassostreae]CAK1758504.1 hypothetical protein VCRA2113O351_140035 [Vibrio crassostreae]CAK1762835.1 hypothetical protein VCRA2117O376_140035 [Vibrio crassostreae]CAK1770354.1 hypothetical protein VCRA2113O199_140086 [Vibrio crassostreae]CAK1778112.1 hypothetical protein VCRA2114O367_150034 [Vibrio crassostreae]
MGQALNWVNENTNFLLSGLGVFLLIVDIVIGIGYFVFRYKVPFNKATMRSIRVDDGEKSNKL